MQQIGRKYFVIPQKEGGCDHGNSATGKLYL
jgi:hypothetical protein